MSLPKVYLAKSNRSNPDLVTRVRQILSSYEVEIVEFTGGKYSHTPLKECKYLVIVPDLSLQIDETICDIGKGLFEQIEYFTDFQAFANIMIISDNELNIRRFENLEVMDDDDYINYGTLYLSNEFMKLKEACYSVFTSKKNDLVLSEVNYKYLLIKRI
jgi:hypothetical protein